MERLRVMIWCNTERLRLMVQQRFVPLIQLWLYIVELSIIHLQGLLRDKKIECRHYTNIRLQRDWRD